VEIKEFLREQVSYDRHNRIYFTGNALRGACTWDLYVMYYTIDLIYIGCRRFQYLRPERGPSFGK
jgi:hypothetical protein